MPRVIRIEINEAIQSTGGQVIPGATVQIDDYDGNAATVYAADTGGSTLANPLTADSAGRVEGYLLPGGYTFEVSKSGYTTYTHRYEAPLTVGRLARTVPHVTTNSVEDRAIMVIEQTRNGAPQGDPIWGIRKADMSDPIKMQAYFVDTGGFHTSREIVVSQKHHGYHNTGVGASSGALIQGVSSTSDGTEPQMVAASTDIDGPAFAGECQTADASGKKNQSAFAAYDLDDLNGGGVTSGSIGYGKKKFVITGTGDLRWGTDLLKDHWANADIRLGRQADGTLSMQAPKSGTATALFRVRATGGGGTQAAGISLGRNGTDDYLQLLTNPSTADNAYLFLNTRVVMRLYSNPVGTTSGACLAVGGTDDNSAIGSFIVGDASTLTKGIVARGKASQSGNLLEVQDSSANPLSGFTENGYFFTRKTSAPADAELSNGELALWFDSTNGAAKLMVKAKEAGGTVRTATVALA